MSTRERKNSKLMANSTKPAVPRTQLAAVTGVVPRARPAAGAVVISTARVATVSSVRRTLGDRCTLAGYWPLGLSGHSARMRLGMGQRVFVYVQSGRYTYRLNAADKLEDYDGDPTSGYEVDTARDASPCGACGVSCPEGAAGRWQAGCSDGASCTEGRADFDGDATNVREVDFAIFVTHCGGCGVVCDVATGCLDGACCPVGFSDCDGSCANACEINLLTEATNCGARDPNPA